jgi:uncharacterized RDD family membrane protein YckC
MSDPPGDGERLPDPPPRYEPLPPYPGYPDPGAQPPPYGPSRYPPGVPTLASFGVRVVAWLLDWLITGAVSALVLVPVHAVRQVTVNGTTSLSVSTQGYLLSALIVITYGTVFIGSKRGQTLGMMALRLRAVDAATGGPVTYARALGRALVEYALLVVLVIPWVIDMLFPLWDPRRQTLHDKALSTVVIRF